jgi:hypothetical protein
VAAVIPHRTKHPLLVVAEQAHDLRCNLALALEDRIHALLAAWPPVAVITGEDHGVAGAAFAANLVEQIDQGGQMTVDVTDSNARHTGSWIRRLPPAAR